MAITAVYGPTTHNPTKDESQYGNLTGDGTEIVFTGGGLLRYVDVIIVGTSVSIHDAGAGDTPSAANQIVGAMATTTVGRKYEPQDGIRVARGLTFVVVGAATQLAIVFNGRPTVSPRSFGS